MQAGNGALTADEQGSMLRALPVALLLLFAPGEPSGAAVSTPAHQGPGTLLLVLCAKETCSAVACVQGLEALGGPKALLRCLRLLRTRPVVPAYVDVPMCLLALLEASPHLSAAGGEACQTLNMQQSSSTRQGTCIPNDGSACSSA